MTTDEMVREIMQLFSAVDYEGRTRPVVLTVYPDRCTARACSHAVDVQGGATAALAALRDQLRDKASDALAEHEAKAETLRRALGIPSPAMAVDDLRAAVREWWAARRGLDHAAQVTTSITEASEACVRFDAADDALRDAMGGEL